MSAVGEIFTGSLTENVFGWYPGWMQGATDSEEGLHPNNQPASFFPWLMPQPKEQSACDRGSGPAVGGSAGTTAAPEDP